MLTCNVVKDLLPNYIDKLVSEKTAQEIAGHLAGCTECNTEYAEMNAKLAPIIVENQNEIDYLKKIKQENIGRILKYSAISVLAATVIFAFSAYIFYIGQPVNSEDFSYKLLRHDDGSIHIEMKLESGRVLNARPEIIMSQEGFYDSIFICTPRQSLKIPFDDMGEDGGSSFSWGYEATDREISDNFRFIFRFADKDVVLTINDF